jgi:polyferredoxin
MTQFGFFILQNPFLKNFVTGEIYQGNTKVVCSPGLNCYSCPAAAVSCPIGATQFFLAGVKHSLSLYVTGFLLMIGAIFGRFICGYVCPMGLSQDLVYRIKTHKLILRLRFLRYLKYVVLIVFVVILPLALTNELSGLGQPWFCKYICPSGTLFGAIPLLSTTEFLRRFAGAQFVLKISLAICILVGSVFVYRVFCRTLCPLGAIYSLMNKIALAHMKCDKALCDSCGDCAKACHIKIEPASQPDSPECVRCGKCINACPKEALSYSFLNR